MKERACSRCGKNLAPGSLTYVVNVRVFADFDGVLLEPEEGMDRELEQILEQVEEANASELERDVYEEFTLFLCKRCRDRFVKETHRLWEGPLRIRKGPGPLLQ
jgi:hypothetical protein